MSSPENEEDSVEGAQDIILHGVAKMIAFLNQQRWPASFGYAVVATTLMQLQINLGQNIIPEGEEED